MKNESKTPAAINLKLEDVMYLSDSDLKSIHQEMIMNEKTDSELFTEIEDQIELRNRSTF